MSFEIFIPLPVFYIVGTILLCAAMVILARIVYPGN